MSEARPTLYLLAGPNGAGKSTFHKSRLERHVRAPFINADRIAARERPDHRLPGEPDDLPSEPTDMPDEWPDDPQDRAKLAARVAAAQRDRLIAARRPFVTETVFSHESKIDLVSHAVSAGFRIELHIVIVPVELSVARVAQRHAGGGHDVPEDRIRARYERLWDYLAQAVRLADDTVVWDSTNVEPDRPAFRPVAVFEHGQPTRSPDWPEWTPQALRDLA